MYLRHYQNYYKSVKEELKSDHACTIIEEVVILTESNMKYLYHYEFIDKNTFDLAVIVLLKQQTVE